MSRVSDSLKSFFKSNKIMQEQIASKLGCSQAYVSGVLSGKRELGRKSVEKWSEVFGFNKVWLLTGEGDMFDDNAMGITSQLYDEKTEFVLENSNGARFFRTPTKLLMTVKLVPFDAYARFLDPQETFDSEREEWEEETFSVPNVVHGQYYAFQVKGDSMDNGMRDSFENGDRILVRKLYNQYWKEKVRFESHPYWVVVTRNNILLKQMIAQDLQNGTFTFHSLNPSVEYADFTLHIDEITSLYYVIKKKSKEIDY